MTCTHTIRRAIGTLALTGAALGASLSAFAEGKGIDDPFRADYYKTLAGRTVGFVPLSMGLDLAQGWLEGLKKELEPLGVKILVRDPNWNTNAGAQAVTTLINEKPDLMVVHNPDVQTYAKLIQKAEKEGIDVVQINMRSVFPSVVYVGADWVEIGEKATTAVVNACKGKSNKILIVQGALAAAASAYTLKGVENVLAKHSEVKVVASQAADWDATKAKGITQTVLKQHPDLCGIVGFWDGMDTGTAAAIKEAGLTGKVFLATMGGGEQKSACDQVKGGVFDLDLSYDVPTQASNMAASIKWLLQNKGKVRDAKGSIYTTLIPITKANAAVEGTCWKFGKI
ncbi:MAG: sugar ABC transporter substrate-binding protein [Burkholderiaceae bacterium]|nr:sugar ABC transporter substrate-binding protein [Burkholderiaceae bacterium]